MTRPTTSGRGSWRLRSVPQHLADRYRAEGWWTDASLGRMVADGLGRHGDVGFHVRSAVRPWHGTFADVDRAARSLAAELGARGVGPGSLVAFQLPNWVEAGITFWAAAYLGAMVVPIVHFYGAKEVGYIVGATEPDLVVTADRFGRADHLAVWEDVLARHPVPLWLVVGDTPADRLPAAATPFAPLLDADPVAGPARRRPRRARDRGVHVGHDARPQGRRALAPHDRLRDPPARADVPHRRPAADHRRAGGPLHRHAQRLPRAAAAGPAGQPDRRLGPGRGPAPDARGGARHGRRGHLLPDEPARPPRLLPRAPGPDALRRPRRVDRARGGHRAGDPPRHQGVPLVRQHRAPVDHRVHRRRPRGQAAHHRRPSPAGRRDAAGGRRRDREPGPRLLPGLHRSRAHRLGVRRRGLVPDRRRGRARRGRLPHDHRPRVRHHHPGRREHQRPGGRGADARPRRHRRGQRRGRPRRPPRRAGRRRGAPAGRGHGTVARRRCATTWRPPGWPARSGPSRCTWSTSSPARRRARSRSSSCASCSARTRWKSHSQIIRVFL